MERVFWIAALGAASACAKPTKPAAIADPLVVVTHGADDIVDVHEAEEIPGYVVTFGKAKGFPTSLQFLGQELLGTGACPLESLVGTALYPGAIAAGDIPEDPTSTLAFDLEGPAVARAKVTYSVPYDCNGTPQHLTGTSTFAFFPFGRIVRHDDATASDTALPAGPECTCSSDNNYFFTSYWTFIPGAAPFTPADQPISEGDYDAPTACFAYNVQGAFIGIRYSDARTRILLTGDNNVSRFVYDFQRTAPSLPMGERGSVDSAIQLSDTQPVPCSQLTEPLEDRGLRVDGRAAVLDGSGIYTDPGSDYGRKVAITGSGPAISPGFVVSLAGVHEHLKVNRENTEETYFLPQLDRAGGRTLVWFRDALLPGETAEIELLE